VENNPYGSMTCIRFTGYDLSPAIGGHPSVLTLGKDKQFEEAAQLSYGKNA